MALYIRNEKSIRKLSAFAMYYKLNIIIVSVSKHTTHLVFHFLIQVVARDSISEIHNRRRIVSIQK